MKTLTFRQIMKRVVISVSCVLFVLNTKLSVNPMMLIQNELLTKDIRMLPKPHD